MASGQGVHIEDLGDRYRFHNVLQNDYSHQIDLFKDLRENGSKRTQKDWWGLDETQEEKTISSIVYFTLLHAMYRNREELPEEHVKGVLTLFRSDLKTEIATGTRGYCYKVVHGKSGEAEQLEDMVAYSCGLDGKSQTSYVGQDLSGEKHLSSTIDRAFRASFGSGDVVEALRWASGSTIAPHFETCVNRPTSYQEGSADLEGPLILSCAKAHGEEKYGRLRVEFLFGKVDPETKKVLNEKPRSTRAVIIHKRNPAIGLDPEEVEMLQKIRDGQPFRHKGKLYTPGREAPKRKESIEGPPERESIALSMKSK